MSMADATYLIRGADDEERPVMVKADYSSGILRVVFEEENAHSMKQELWEECS